MIALPGGFVSLKLYPKTQIAAILASMTAALDRSQVLEIARRHGASRVRVSGSYARGQQTRNSDVDPLVELEPHRDLFDLIELKRELEERFQRRFDGVTERGLSPYIRDNVLQDARPL